MTSTSHPPAGQPAPHRHEVGRDLRKSRHALSLPLADTAARAGTTPSTLPRIENGQAPAKPGYLPVLPDLYGTGSPAERARLTGLVRQGQGNPWWSAAGWVLPEGGGTYLDLETAATTVSIHATHAIPGIAQTLPYALEAARLTRPDLTDFECSLLARLQALRRHHLRPGCQLHLIIDEAALIKYVGNPDATTAQLRHLLALAAEPGITLQLTSWHTTPAVLSPSFTVLTFPDTPAVTCCQGPAGNVILSRRPADTETARATYHAITQAAATPGQSAGYIKLLTGQDD